MSSTVNSYIYCLVLFGRFNKNIKWTWRVANVYELEVRVKYLFEDAKGRGKLGDTTLEMVVIHVIAQLWPLFTALLLFFLCGLFIFRL
jgi:hypothetical protein